MSTYPVEESRIAPSDVATPRGQELGRDIDEDEEDPDIEAAEH